MVRLQCPHLALAAPAPQLSSPSVQSANVERGRGSGTQKFVYQKWPDRIVPIVNLVFPPRSSLWSGGGVPRGRGGDGVLLRLSAVLTHS